MPSAIDSIRLSSVQAVINETEIHAEKVKYLFLD